MEKKSRLKLEKFKNYSKKLKDKNDLESPRIDNESTISLKEVPKIPYNLNRSQSSQLKFVKNRLTKKRKFLKNPLPLWKMIFTNRYSLMTTRDSLMEAASRVQKEKFLRTLLENFRS